jgi:hypothetical protein
MFLVDFLDVSHQCAKRPSIRLHSVGMEDGQDVGGLTDATRLSELGSRKSSRVSLYLRRRVSGHA